MLKNGFRFVITKNNLIGEIDGVTTTGIYNVLFYENNVMYLNGIPCFRADVYENTIINNLKAGAYKAF